MRKLQAALIAAAALAALCFASALLAAAGGEATGALAGLEIISPERADEFPEPDGAVELRLDGEALPCDARSGAYLIPQSARAELFDGAALVREPGFDYYLCPSAEGGMAEALAGETAFDLYGVLGEACRRSRVILTPQPVLCLTTDGGELPSDADEGGALIFYWADEGGLHCEQSRIEINERGNTSRRMPKKSYRVRTVDALGEKQHVSLAGLRADDDWILNPLYADTSKIREKLGYELWETFNSCGRAAASSRMEYVEVFLNGEYWGLYGLQERVDSKQVGGDKRADLLYKIVANDRPGVQELWNCKSGERCRAFELLHGDRSGAENLWAPAAAYMAYLEGEEASGAALNGDNLADYGLWAMFTQAHDNHFKNQFLNCVWTGEGYEMYKIPWDLNHTFGDVWRGEDEENNFTGYMIGSLVTDGAFEVYLGSGAAARRAVCARWRALRAQGLDAQSVIARARELHAEIQGARARDSLRWPECGMGEGNAMNIRDVEDFVETMVARMDEYIARLEGEG